MTGPSTLSRELGALASGSESPIRKSRVAREKPSARVRALHLAWLVPAGLVVYELIRIARGVAPTPHAWAWLLGLTLVPPLLSFGVSLWSAWHRDVARRVALGAVDRAAGLEDRLVTADEFLASGVQGGFQAAAIEDAAAHIAAARVAVVRVDTADAPEPRVSRPRMFGAAALLLLAFGLGRVAVGSADTVDDPDPDSVVIAAQARPDKSATPGDAPSAETPQRTPAASKRAEADQDPSRDDSQVGEDVKQTRGSLGAGKPAAASASQGSSNSKAAPTNQGQSAKTEEKRKPKEKKITPPKPASEDQPPPKKKPGDESGTTAGRGSSRGSNKNPATSEWSSKDQVTNPEDEAVEDDDEIEDEEEEQESRGGIQPNLRDRKPPVNRDLRIGFGNRKNPDANGRGGPSEQKKSRGVASLVLGVPVPDRIKGQPNRGKTKITQERIEPKKEAAEAISAADRTARNRPVGSVTRHDLRTSMRRLIRKYFLTPREIDS